MPPKPTQKAASRGRGAPGGATRGGAVKRGGGRGGTKAAAAAKPEPKKEEKKVKKWTEQDVAATKIQKLVRGFLARLQLRRLRKAKDDYEEEMKRLEKEALLAVVRRQQEEAEKLRQKEEEERRRVIEHNKRKKRMLEAAFDGDMGEIRAILKEVADLDTKFGLGNDTIGKNLRARHQLDMADCEDPHKNTPLSEAASGGQSDVIRFLIDQGVRVNSTGQFQRTPLYRAAFAGHVEACELLLEAGADPRIYAEDAQAPVDVAATGPVKGVFEGWDIGKTEVLLEKIEKDRARRAEEDRRRHEAEVEKIENRMKLAQKDYKAAELRFKKAQTELNKRIYEHDHAATEGFDRPEVTEAAIHDAEFELESAKLEAEKCRTKLADIKLELREKNAQEEGEEEAARPGIHCAVRELDDVLLRDVGNRLRESGKWGLLVDRSGQATTFLRYRDTNYLNVLSANLQPRAVRLALLGAMRFGKPLVVDMMQFDAFDIVRERFDAVKKGLLDLVLSKAILKPENYVTLIEENDGPEYAKENFQEARVENFKLFLTTTNPYPDDNLLDQFTPIWVTLPEH